MLADFHNEKGFLREVDLFIVGTVLQYLTLKKHIAAAVALHSYAQRVMKHNTCLNQVFQSACLLQHPALATSKSGNPPFKHPLMNFVWLLLLAIEHKQSVSAFTTLIDKYKPSLKR